MNLPEVIAQMVSDAATPVNLLFGANVALSSAMLALYRDCRNDRTKLWAHVMSLEARLTGKK